MFSRKGVIEIQFNWIFIMIVGGLILMFFIAIVVQQGKVSNKRISSSISLDMQSIFSGAQISTNTEHTVDIPPVNILFECEDGYSSYSVGDSVITLGDSIVIFSPDMVYGKSREIITWTLDWNAPYRVTNFLYITSPYARYVIVNDNPSLSSYVHSALPDLIFKELTDDYAGIDDRNNYRVRIARFGDLPEQLPVPEDLAALEDESVSLVSIESSGGTLKGTGKVHFYSKNGVIFEREGTSAYLNEASVYGAIYSEDMAMYECNMAKAFKRLNILSMVYSARAGELYTYFMDNPDPQRCRVKISQAKDYVDDIIERSEVFSIQAVGGVYSSMQDLRTTNKEIQRLSCPVIY